MSDLILVRSADPERVGLWERNLAHPGGEVFVAGDDVVEVALTAEVQGRLNSGVLVLVERPEPAIEKRKASK